MKRYLLFFFVFLLHFQSFSQRYWGDWGISGGSAFTSGDDYHFGQKFGYNINSNLQCGIAVDLKSFTIKETFARNSYVLKNEDYTDIISPVIITNNEELERYFGFGTGSLYFRVSTLNIRRVSVFFTCYLNGIYEAQYSTNYKNIYNGTERDLITEFNDEAAGRKKFKLNLGFDAGVRFRISSDLFFEAAFQRLGKIKYTAYDLTAETLDRHEYNEIYYFKLTKNPSTLNLYQFNFSLVFSIYAKR